jgi:hypothetical protein
MTMKISRAGASVLLEGVIDENADFSPLLRESAPLRIDFSRVTRINSIGVRSWMKFLTQWGDKSLEYLQCPAVISEQLIVTPVLLGVKKRVAKVVSAYIAFVCPKCNESEDRMVTFDQLFRDVSPETKAPPCKQCGACMTAANSACYSIFDPPT